MLGLVGAVESPSTIIGWSPFGVIGALDVWEAAEPSVDIALLEAEGVVAVGTAAGYHPVGVRIHS